MNASTIDDLLPPIMWRVAVLNGNRLSARAHAVRNGHTLCGYTESSVAWSSEDPDGVPRCPSCHRIPDNYGTSQDLVRLGMTYRQMDFWCRRGYLIEYNPDPGSGTRRIFAPGEVLVAASMMHLVAAGIPPGIARRAARNDGWLSPSVRVTVGANSR